MTPDDPRHGTYAGALAHRAAKEQPCDPCRLAYNEYHRSIRKDPAIAERTRRRNRARSRALWRLATAYRDEYERLYLDEMRKERGVA